MEFRRAHTSLSAHSLSLGGYIHHIIQVEAGFPAGEKLRLMLLIVLRFCHPCGRTESGASFAFYHIAFSRLTPSFPLISRMSCSLKTEYSNVPLCQHAIPGSADGQFHSVPAFNLKSHIIRGGRILLQMVDKRILKIPNHLHLKLRIS